MITIEHSHADGTLLTGSSRGDGVWEIARTHGFRCSRSVGIYLRDSRDRDARRELIDRLATALREAGHEVTVQIDDDRRSAAEREAARGERTAARAERLDGLAAAAERRAGAATAAHDRIADGIPLGQPRLIGHHSYARHTRDLTRMDAADRRARDESDAAAEYTRRAAAAVGNEAAKSNPRAIMRRIERQEAELRGWQRSLAAASAGSDAAERAAREVAWYEDNLAHDRAKLAALAETGTFVAWSRETIRIGDRVRTLGSWYSVTRINAKSVSVAGTGWPRTIAWSEITGMRRPSTGQQWDSPDAEPWSIDDAVAVETWLSIMRTVRSAPRWDERAMRVESAKRLAVGLPVTASANELAAFDVQTVEAGRARAIASLALYRALETGLSPAEAVLMVSPPATVEPTWRMPAGVPDRVRVDRLVPGMIIAGLEDGNGELWRGCTGPVATVSEVEHHRERGDWVTFTLADGSEHRYQTHVWFAVHRPV